MNVVLVLIPLVPLLGSVVVALAGRRLAGPIAATNCALSFLGTVVLLAGGLQERVVRAAWGKSGSFTLEAGLRFDALSGTTAFLVSAVSLAVLIYSLGYFTEEKGRARFFAAMSFFVGAMLALVLADSLIVLFAAWEWVGLASWFLIGFYYRLEEARRAARKAFLMTRIGDAALLAGWLLAWMGTGTTEISAFVDQVKMQAFSPEMVTLLGLLFLAGAIGKSAQLPLSAWLPPAMAGPTPVSALIHSATMVAAGVYLLLRLWPLFEASPLVLTVLLWVGGATALFAALVATAQSDLKRVLAWSTVSQLGEMMLALGLAGPLAAAFHLAAHATFKSTLFLAAGSLEHGTGTRRLHGLKNLWRTMPWTSASFALAALALAGVPPFSGFWSEEKILAAAISKPLAAILLLLVIFLAGVYIGRATISVFASPFGEPGRGKEQGPAMRWTVALMALIAAVAGWPLGKVLEKILPFTTPPHLGWSWRLAGIVCALAGLLVGIWRTRQTSAAGAFGNWPVLLEKGLWRITLWPAEMTLFLARGIEWMEEMFDVAAWNFSRLIQALADGSRGAEAGFDAAGRSLSQISIDLAAGTQSAEAGGFGKGGDALGRSLFRGGDRLGRAETGKVYLYNLGFFLWVLALVMLGLCLILLR